MKQFILLLVFIVMILQSCEEETDWKLQPSENGQLVVEAVLTNILGPQSLRLSLSYDDLNGIPTPVTDAIVFINNGQNNFPFFEDPTDPGKYNSPQAAALQGGINYELIILWKEKRYTAKSEMVQVFPFGKLSFQSIGQSDSMKIVEPPNFYSLREQAMYELDIDWSHLTSNEPNQAKMVFYTFQTLDVNELFRPDAQDVSFPRGSIVVVKKYGLNDAFATYLRALVMETEWQGGFLDEASASLPTNISNGGLGFFSVCAVRVDTLVAE